MIGYWHKPVVRLSVCDAVHCGSQGLCRGLKVVPTCSEQACSYLSLLTLFLQDVSFSHKTRPQKNERTAYANVSFARPRVYRLIYLLWPAGLIPSWSVVMLEWFSECVRLIELRLFRSTAHGPKLVTTGLIVRQQFINARLDLYLVLLL